MSNNRDGDEVIGIYKFLLEKANIQKSSKLARRKRKLTPPPPPILVRNTDKELDSRETGTSRSHIDKKVVEIRSPTPTPVIKSEIVVARPSAAPPPLPPHELSVAELTAKQKRAKMRKARREEIARGKARDKNKKKLVDDIHRIYRESIGNKSVAERLQKKKVIRQRKADKNTCVMLGNILDGLINTLDNVKCEYTRSYIDLYKGTTPLKILSRHIKVSMGREARGMLLTALIEVMNSGLDKELQDKLPRKCRSHIIGDYVDNCDPLTLFFKGVFMQYREETILLDITRKETVNILFDAINLLTADDAADKYPYYFANSPWNLGYHVIWATMGLLLGDNEKYRGISYMDIGNNYSNGEYAYRFRDIRKAEELFHIYLRFAAKRSANMVSRDSNVKLYKKEMTRYYGCGENNIDGDKYKREVNLEWGEYHMMHYDMLRMFFQHIWPVCVASYIKYPIMGTDKKKNELLSRYPLPHLFMFVQASGYTCLEFPINFARLSILFINNGYEEELALEINNSFKEHLTLGLERDCLASLGEPYMKKDTLMHRYNMFCYRREVENNVHNVKMVKNIDMMVRKEVREDINNYMLSCGLANYIADEVLIEPVGEKLGVEDRDILSLDVIRGEDNKFSTIDSSEETDDDTNDEEIDDGNTYEVTDDEDKISIHREYDNNYIVSKEGNIRPDIVGLDLVSEEDRRSVADKIIRNNARRLSECVDNKHVGNTYRSFVCGYDIGTKYVDLDKYVVTTDV